MKDVEKTNVERENSSKRMRRRKRHMNLYMIVVIILVVCIGITVSYTFLFNINKIEVSGEASEHTVDEIVAASGVSLGDNLLRVNCEKSEKKILDELLYIETAKVHKKFPFSLQIKVSRCIPGFNVSYEMGTLLVSQKGKILENNGYITEGLPVIYGYDPYTTTASEKLDTKDEHKREIYKQLTKEILENLDKEIKIVSIDMTDSHDIQITYSNEIVFKMGNWNDIPYKLSLADNVMEKVGNEKGYISMIGSNQCSFRTSENSGFETVITTEPPVPVTDADGENVTEENDENVASTQTTTTYIDEEEEMFREHDEQNLTTTTTVTDAAE